MSEDKKQSIRNVEKVEEKHGHDFSTRIPSIETPGGIQDLKEKVWESVVARLEARQQGATKKEIREAINKGKSAGKINPN